jgi:hypothetical protein
MNPQVRLFTAVSLICACCDFTGNAEADARLAVAPDDKAIAAIWRVHHLHFDYYSPNTSYSCSALQKKIRAILQAVGAVAVEMRCYDARVRFVRVYISFAAPVEATEENILSATSFEGREVLAAQLKGVALPTSTDIERFWASWQRISLARLRLQNGDCDLLNSLRAQIFPKLRIDEATGFNCSVGSTRLPPILRVESLIRRVPRPTSTLRSRELLSTSSARPTELRQQKCGLQNRRINPGSVGSFLFRWREGVSRLRGGPT